MLKWISSLPSKQRLRVRVLPGAQENMKKIFLLIILLSIIFAPVFASAAGLVPCTGAVTCTGTAPNQTCTTDCTISAFFTLILNIYNFIVQDIATPLAILSISIGGIIMMISAGNPNLLGLGKKIFYAAIIGLVLVFCSWLIINFIMQAVGYTANGGAWSSLP